MTAFFSVCIGTVLSRGESGNAARFGNMLSRALKGTGDRFGKTFAPTWNSTTCFPHFAPTAGFPAFDEATIFHLGQEQNVVPYLAPST